MDSIDILSWWDELRMFGEFQVYENRNYKITKTKQYNACYYSKDNSFAFGHLARGESEAMRGLVKSLKEELWKRCNNHEV